MSDKIDRIIAKMERENKSSQEIIEALKRAEASLGKMNETIRKAIEKLNNK